MLVVIIYGNYSSNDRDWNVIEKLFGSPEALFHTLERTVDLTGHSFSHGALCPAWAWGVGSSYPSLTTPQLWTYRHVI